jgi:hypothetical protein
VWILCDSKDGAIVNETHFDAGTQNIGNTGLVADKMKTISQEAKAIVFAD